MKNLKIFRPCKNLGTRILHLPLYEFILSSILWMLCHYMVCCPRFRIIKTCQQMMLLTYWSFCHGNVSLYTLVLLQLVKRHAAEIFTSVIVSTLFSLYSTALVGRLVGLEPTLTVSIIPRCITVALALSIVSFFEGIVMFRTLQLEAGNSINGHPQKNAKIKFWHIKHHYSEMNSFPIYLTTFGQLEHNVLSWFLWLITIFNRINFTYWLQVPIHLSQLL